MSMQAGISIYMFMVDTTTQQYTGSLKAEKSTICRPLVHPGGGRRLRTRIFATIIHPNMRNAAALTPHPNPTESNNRLSIIGKQTPPNDEPETVIPIASPLRFKNQVLIHRIAVLNLSLEKIVRGDT